MAAVNSQTNLKDAVRAHWQNEPCGSREIDPSDRRAFFQQIEQERYELEPYILDFARFPEGRGKQILEIGVGAGTDFTNWVRNGADATGIDLTERGVQLTLERLAIEGLKAKVGVGDAENLPFEPESFDLVYSWGVLHHSPDTEKAIREVHRVLKPGGSARVMIYQSNSWVGLMLWGVHCLGRLKPWKSPKWAVYHHLESPGTKTYTKTEARRLFSPFSSVQVSTQLTHADLLQMRPAQQYKSWYHRLAWSLYPRWAIKRTGNALGTFMFIEAVK